ncbi:MAG: hydrogenase accessory protein HypB [Lentisphaerae bacterium GWF2_52_8]|nr:MAG: hydrogenase accessory protein HypB [Lentisphaerae bacterium GWF2_52_8]
MCKDCGCGEPKDKHRKDAAHGGKKNHMHQHDGHWHSHDDDHDHEHKHEHSHHNEESRTVSVASKVLAANDEIAGQNRKWLAERGVIALNLISSPGSGKTALLEKTLELLKDNLPCAVIVGDQRTDNDARRLSGRGAPVKQIETYSSCHLSAEHIAKVLPEIVTPGIKLLFIENVGNLVCPAAFDLGEHCKIALLSTPEGEDKPVKYPVLFSEAAVVLITKTDLAPHLDWEAAKCREHIRSVHPGAFIFELSAKTGEGMNAWIDYLKSLNS